MSAAFFVIYLASITGMIIVATITAIGSYSKNKSFFVASIYAASLWLLIQFFVQAFSLDGDFSLKLIQFAAAVSLTMALFFYCFIKSYIGSPVSKKILILFSLLSAVGLLINMFGLTVRNAVGHSTGIVINDATPLYNIFIISVGVIFVIALVKLIRFAKNIKSKKDKAKNRLMIIGILQAVVIIVASNSFLQLSAQSQIIMPISLFVMSVIIGFAIIKYQFFDIRAAVIRTFAYALSLLTLSVIYYVLAYLLSVFLFKDNMSSSLSVSPINIALALVLAFVFQPIKKFFDKYTNKFFYKDGYISDEFFAKINKTLGSTIDLRGLLERAAIEIGHTLKGEQAFFFINTEDGHYITAGTPHHKLLSKADADQLAGEKTSKNGVIIASLLENTDPIRRLMISYRIELILPLIKERDVIGFLCLGEHLTSNYTNKDIGVLNAIASGLIIAIQNALAVQEIREFNTTLQQKVANATEELRASNRMLRQLDKAKDEFVGMASHQLRTPLTSVKGYISMVIDGDAGKITDSQKQLLNEAFNSSERMVNLINDFLNVSRIQTGKFIIEKNTLDLPNLVEQELSNLQPSAVAHGITFNFVRPIDFPKTIADESKIRQVVMNFLDNAIYYSPDNTIVNVDVSVRDNEAVFTVKDNGIGVPMSEKSQLFSKFYRASNARRKRPDGTGVGLYLAKKIITAHDGKLIFESTEGKGSTFGFRLPIKDLNN